MNSKNEVLRTGKEDILLKNQPIKSTQRYILENFCPHSTSIEIEPNYGPIEEHLC